MVITGQYGVQVIALYIGDPGLIPDATFIFLTPVKGDPRSQHPEVNPNTSESGPSHPHSLNDIKMKEPVA